MSERSKLISRLLLERDYRAAYIRAKLDVLIPSQLRALRLRQEKTQPELAKLADMKQSRISAMETPGQVNFNLETLVRMAATLNVGLMVKLVPFSELLMWENEYSQEVFDVTRLPNDTDFLEPVANHVFRRGRRKRASACIIPNVRTSQIPAMAGGGASRAQMKLQFEPSEAAPIQSKVAKVITLPSQSRSLLDELPLLKTAAGAGAGTRYGN